MSFFFQTNILPVLDVDTLSSDYEVQAWAAKLTASKDAGGCGIGVRTLYIFEFYKFMQDSFSNITNR